MLFDDSCPKGINHNEPGGLNSGFHPLHSFASVASVPACYTAVSYDTLVYQPPFSIALKHLIQFHVPPTRLVGKKSGTPFDQLSPRKP